MPGRHRWPVAMFAKCALAAVLLVSAACSSADALGTSPGDQAPATTESVPSEAAPATTTPPPTTATAPPATSTTVTTTTAVPPPTTTTQPPPPTPLGLYPQRVYVPNSRSNTVQVIDPITYEVVESFRVGRTPHHISPTIDQDALYVLNTSGDSLTVLDPITSLPIDEIKVVDPYNLYFTPDGAQVIIVAERLRRLDFYNRHTWEREASVRVEQAGVDHLAFSESGTYLVASAEFSGYIVKVDLINYEVTGLLRVGGQPIDVVRDPDFPNLMWVANQRLHGVHVIDSIAMQEIDFIPTGKGAHGLLLSRDKSSIYVSNRREGSISVLDLASRTVTETWKTGYSPDMGLLNPDGTRLWISNRYDESVMVIDTATGEVLAVIPTQTGPHGLTYFPTTCGYATGHNGVCIDELTEPRHPYEPTGPSVAGSSVY